MLNRNRPTAYLLPPHVYEAMLAHLNAELRVAIAEGIESGPSISLVKPAVSVQADYVIIAGEMWSSPAAIQAEWRETLLHRDPTMQFKEHDEFLAFFILGEGRHWAAFTPLIGGFEVRAERTFGPIEFIESKVDEPEFLNAVRHIREMTTV